MSGKAIGSTASITLLTGLPGSGKSARIIQWILEATRRGELVYACNVDGIKVPGVMPWQDPTKWRELPAGSVLVVDEAQQFFRARRGGDPPEYITAMEKIRHDGVRLILATQQPNYLDTHLRGLVGLHEHLLREDGRSKTFIVRNNTVMDDVRQDKKRAKDRYDYEEWKIPKEVFSCYESAQVHTVKYTMPAKLKKAMILGPLALAMFVGVFAMIFHDGWSKAHAADAPGGKTPASPASQPGASSAAIVGHRENQPRSAEEFAKMLTPTMPGVMWSAPAWSGQQVVSDPHLYCMASGQDGRDGCTCTTEQGTRVKIDLDQCWQVARYGEPYNPFKRPHEEREASVTSSARAESGHSPIGARSAIGTESTALVQPQGAFARSEPVMPAVSGRD